MRRSPTLAARQLSWLFAAAGVLSFAAIAVSSAPRLSLATTGCGALLSAGLAAWLPRTPWRRLPDLVLLVPATALLAAAGAAHLLPSRSYSSLFILLFAWVGAHQRPRTGMWIAPAMFVAYALPLMLSEQQVPFSPAAGIVSICVGVLVAEGMSRTIAARVAAEQASALTAETLRVILDRSPQATIALDARGRCMLANSTAAAEFGAEPETWSAPAPMRCSITRIRTGRRTRATSARSSAPSPRAGRCTSGTRRSSGLTGRHSPSNTAPSRSGVTAP